MSAANLYQVKSKAQRNSVDYLKAVNAQAQVQDLRRMEKASEFERMGILNKGKDVVF